MSDDLISAEKAREMLSRATRSPWRCYGNAPDDTTPSDEWTIAHDGVLLATLYADDLPECDGAEVAARVEANADLMAAARDLAETVVALHARLAVVESERDAALAQCEVLTQALRETQRKLDEAKEDVGRWQRSSAEHHRLCVEAQKSADFWRETESRTQARCVALGADARMAHARCDLLVADLQAAVSERDALRAAVLNTKALLSTCDEGERWRVHVEEAAWEALEKLAGGGR